MAQPELNMAPRDEGWRPLADRMRPATLDEFVGQAHLLAPGKPLRRLLEGRSLAGRYRKEKEHKSRGDSVQQAPYWPLARCRATSLKES